MLLIIDDVALIDSCAEVGESMMRFTVDCVAGVDSTRELISEDAILGVL